MKRFLWSAFLLPGLTACAFSGGAADPYAVPVDRVTPEQRENVRYVLESEPLVIVIPRTRIQSRLEIYEFLLEELPFTAGVVRALEKGRYEIFRESEAPGESEAEKYRREHTYHLDDKDGLELAAELVYREPGKWVYYVWGKFALLLEIRGRGVIVVTAEQNGGSLDTEARVFLESGPVVKAVPAIAESVVRKKAGIFVDAARTVTEVSAEDPAALIRNVRGSPSVDDSMLRRYEEYLTP